jgi:hypothetical protein
MRSIIYKEWIKIRWALSGILVLGIIALGMMFLRVRHDIIFVDAANYWYSFLFRGTPYYNLLKYIPLVGGLGLAIAQYFPETVSRRIKLTFHLPVSENEILLKMHLFGAACLFVIFLLLIVTFLIISGMFFPSDIYFPSLISILPWFLGGLAAYFMSALVLLEPIWLYRGIFTVLGGGFISLFYYNSVIGGYKPVIVTLLVLTLGASVTILFSGYRFRKGEM